MSDDTNMIALVKGIERYVFLYTDSRRKDIMRAIARFALNPDLAFTWYDAAVLTQKIRAIAERERPRNRLLSDGGLP